MPYNVVNEYAWCSPSSFARRSEAPYVSMTGGRLAGTQLQQAAQGYLAVIAGAADPDVSGRKFLEDLYKFAEETTPGDSAASATETFTFPFFNSNVRDFSNEYSDTFSQVSQRGAKFAAAGALELAMETADSLIGSYGQIGKMMEDPWFEAAKAYIMGGPKVWKGEKAPTDGHYGTSGSPGTYIESPMFYQYGNNDAALQVSFVLNNTVSPEDTQKNIDFIKFFTKFNRPQREGALTVHFPAVYKGVTVPGHRYIEWAYCSGFSIELLGSRMMQGPNDGGYESIIVPEAYRCDFSFTSLTMEVAYMVDEAFN